MVQGLRDVDDSSAPPSARSGLSIAGFFLLLNPVLLNPACVPLGGSDFPDLCWKTAGDKISFFGRDNSHALAHQIRREAVLSIALGTRNTGNFSTSNQ